MAWFYNLRIQLKLMAGFGLVLALVGVIAFIGVTRLAAIEDDNAALYEHNTLGIQYILQANANMIASAREELRAAVEKDPATRDGWIKQSRDEMAAASKNLESYKATFATPADRQEWSTVKAMVEKVASGREAALKLLESGDDDGAAAARKALSGDIASMNKNLNDISLSSAERAKAAKDSAASDAATGRMVLIVGTIVALLLGLAIAIFIARNVRQGVAVVVDRLNSITNACVSYLQAGIKAVEQGDLTVDAQPVTAKIPNPHKDEVGQAGATINLMLDKLVETMGSYNTMRRGLSEIVGGVRHGATSVLSASNSLRESSDQMAAATGQIAKAINEVTLSAVTLASLSEDSAQEVERVAAGSQELAATAVANAETAAESRSEAAAMSERIESVAATSTDVAAAAEESGRAAAQGQRAVREAVESMESIAATVERAQQTVDQLGSYSEQIGDIVQTISGIAAQTNLLALNAAIEAVAAGEQGRGFAVVADNVRRLAEQSSQSAKEISGLVAKVQMGTSEVVEAMNEGVQDVRRGRQITAEAGDALASIIKSVDHSAVQMKQIAAEVQGLQDGATRIAKSAESLAASSEQSASSTMEMASSTSKVTDTILQVSSTSEETSASTEEVSASTEELSAQSEELAATANEMQLLAESLNEATNRFKLADTLIDASNRFGSPGAVVDKPASSQDVAEEASASLKLAA